MDSSQDFGGQIYQIPAEKYLLLKISAGKRHNFPRGMNSGNNFPQNTRESIFVAFRDKSA